MVLALCGVFYYPHSLGFCSVLFGVVLFMVLYLSHSLFGFGLDVFFLDGTGSLNDRDGFWRGRSLGKGGVRIRSMVVDN